MNDAMTTSTAPPPKSSRKWVWIVVVGLVVVLLAGGAAIYFVALKSDSPEKLTLGDSPTATSVTTGAVALPGNWTVTQGSTAGYRVRERLSRLPAPSDAVGRTPDVKGGFTIATQSGQIVASEMKVEVNVATLASDENRRDNRIRTQGLESNKFPTATFVATEAVNIPQSVADTGRATTSVTGDLTIHGVTKRVTIPLEVQRSGDTIEVVGSITFPFADYGMTPPDVAGIVTVDPNPTMEFKLIFAKA